MPPIQGAPQRKRDSNDMRAKGASTVNPLVPPFSDVSDTFEELEHGQQSGAAKAEMAYADLNALPTGISVMLGIGSRQLMYSF